MTKLSILICTTPQRYGFLNRLFIELEKQLPPKGTRQPVGSGVISGIKNTKINIIHYGDIEILVCDDNGVNTIGTKRNLLLQWSNGEYVAFFDDDDLPGEDYIEELMNGVASGSDCCSLVGEITTDGADPKIFKHFLGCERYEEDGGVYLRYPNHLNCIKSSIAKQFKFPEINHGEDTDWATQIHKAGVLKTQYDITKTIYHYQYRRNK